MHGHTNIKFKNKGHPVTFLAGAKGNKGLSLLSPNLGDRWESYPCTGLGRPLGLQDVEAPSVSIKSAHKSGKVSAQRTGRFNPPVYITGTHFC